MRHHLLDPKTQQQQQQSFLASLQQQTTMVKDVQKSVIPSTSVIKQEDFNLIEPSTINNCIISMNSNGQYQIKQTHPRIIVKDQVKTMSPLMFPTTTGIHQQQQSVVTTIGSVNTSNIQSKFWSFKKSGQPNKTFFHSSWSLFSSPYGNGQKNYHQKWTNKRRRRVFLWNYKATFWNDDGFLRQ